MVYLTQTLLPLRRPKPKLQHPPEVYEAILREHRSDPVRLATFLQACGWSLADAGWAAARWDLAWLAAAVANERAARAVRLTNLSDAELARLKVELEATERRLSPPASSLKPKRTTRLLRSTPRFPPRSPKQPEGPKG